MYHQDYLWMKRCKIRCRNNVFGGKEVLMSAWMIDVWRMAQTECIFYPSASSSVTFRSKSSCSWYLSWTSASKSELFSNWRVLAAIVPISMALTCCSSRCSMSVLSTVVVPIRCCFRIKSRLSGVLGSVESGAGGVSSVLRWTNGSPIGWIIFDSLKTLNFSSRFASMFVSLRSLFTGVRP